MTPEALEVRAFILASLRQQLAAIGMDAPPNAEDFDLRSAGVIDSLGFIQLITACESRFACFLDLSEVPIEQLTNLAVLSRHIATQIGSAESVRTTLRNSGSRRTR
jgi:acyl carrier protein